MPLSPYAGRLEQGDPALAAGAAGRVALHRRRQQQQNAFAGRFIWRLRDELLNETLRTLRACGLRRLERFGPSFCLLFSTAGENHPLHLRSRPR
jgi:hypothetical protein